MKRLNTLSIFMLFTIFCVQLTNAQTVQRKVLFEEMTNASCGPCAQNNPALKSYIQSKGDSIVAVKYHCNFPGFDPMHNHNPTQNIERYSTYYGMNAAPWLDVDGKAFHDVWPFTLTNLDNAYYTRIAMPTPIGLTVTDTRLSGDTIMSVVTVSVLSTLPAGNYKLRVFAIEGVINYGTPPGSNGETVFEHVFRKAYPNTTGTDIDVSVGTHIYTFKYKTDPVWVNANIHTVAFVQNDAAVNKESMNAASGEDSPTGITNNGNTAPEKFSLAQNYPNPFNPATIINFEIPVQGSVKLAVYNSIGKEVAVIVNERLSAGSYKTQFNGEGLSSGVYYYKLTTEGFTETKKMLLIK